MNLLNRGAILIETFNHSDRPALRSSPAFRNSHDPLVRRGARWLPGSIRVRVLAFAVFAAACGIALVCETRSTAQTNINADELFNKTDVMIPVRDGVKLHTIIYAPKSQSEPLPIIFRRTPYGIDGPPGFLFNNYYKELAAEGYIFVLQDIRGRFKSEGQFVMQRPLRNNRDSTAIDESTDTYDTIAWLLKNVPNNNGRVGMLGISYDGWLTVMGMLDPHPALKAVSPQASPADMYLGDDFHHNGAFRLSYGFEYAAMMETAKDVEQFQFDKYDTYEWYLKLGALSNVNAKYLHGKIPTWNDYVLHPNYDAFWVRQAFPRQTPEVTVPTLNVAGWWDQEDFYGPLRIYKTLEKNDPRHINFLAAGPWNHGGWGRGDGSKLGKIDFGSPTSLYFREKIQAPFFAYHLKDKGSLHQAEATTFQTGSNKWTTYDSWPPHESTLRPLYLREGRKLSFEKPGSQGVGYDSYISDPANPVPYRPRPIEPTYYPKGSGWYTWLLEDQRFVEGRPDVLSFESETLAEDVVVAGEIEARIFASTSGTDSDWIVKLIDVYPEDYPKDHRLGGYRLMIANDVFRGRFRKNFEHPAPVEPGQVNEYTIDLHSVNHRFLKGHRIMVQVQSTWFPIIDRNPQKYVLNIFKAKDSDYRVATQRVYRSSRYPSHILIPVIAGE
jgi:putative CocE/NonD family hydrolase